MRQDVTKFRRVESFARALPVLRETIVRDLGLDGAPKERVMAAAVRLLDRATFRIGSEEYADRHGSFGLATIRKSHVHVEGSVLTFDYVSKAGVRQVHRIDDPLLVPVVEQLKQRRSGGHELLAYRDGRRWRDVRSADINAYLKELLGEEHSAKDFRTWHATVLAAIDIARVPAAGDGERAAKRSIATTVRRSPNIWATRLRSAGPPTSTPGCSTGSERGDRRAGAPPGPRRRRQAREAVELAVLDLLGDEGRTSPPDRRRAPLGGPG